MNRIFIGLVMLNGTPLPYLVLSLASGTIILAASGVGSTIAAPGIPRNATIQTIRFMNGNA